MSKKSTDDPTAPAEPVDRTTLAARIQALEAANRPKPPEPWYLPTSPRPADFTPVQGWHLSECPLCKATVEVNDAVEGMTRHQAGFGGMACRECVDMHSRGLRPSRTPRPAEELPADQRGNLAFRDRSQPVSA